MESNKYDEFDKISADVVRQETEPDGIHIHLYLDGEKIASAVCKSLQESAERGLIPKII